MPISPHRRNFKMWMFAAILTCGTTMVLTSCGDNDDKSDSSSTLPKSYHLVADEYKEVVLDPELEAKYARIVQDQGEKFTIDSPQTIRFKDLRDKTCKGMFK